MVVVCDSFVVGAKEHVSKVVAKKHCRGTINRPYWPQPLHNSHDKPSTIVATYSTTGMGAKSKVCLLKRKMRGSRHQRLFKENARKTKRGLQIFKIRVRELFTHIEGINTTRARHEGQ